VFFIFNSSSPVSQYLLINLLRRFSEVSQSVQAAALRSTVSAHSLFTIFCIAKNLLLYRSLYIRKLLLGRHLNWTIDFLTPLCTVKRSFDSHAAEEQRTWSEFRISSFFFRELLWFMLFYLHPYWRHSSLRCQLSELPAACKWQQIKNLTASLCCQSTASKTCIALESCYIIVLTSHRMHRVHICGLLLPMFRGLCVCLHVRVCISVEHKHEPYRNGLTNRDAVWNVDSGGPKKRSWGPDPKERDNFRGISRPTEKRDIRRERKLFGRWQQRCGCSLSVLQQLVYLNVEWTAEMRTVMMTIKTRTTTM